MAVETQKNFYLRVDSILFTTYSILSAEMKWIIQVIWKNLGCVNIGNYFNLEVPEYILQSFQLSHFLVLISIAHSREEKIIFPQSF